MANISLVLNNIMEEKQSTEILEEPKRKFGGAQPGAGRKLGTTNKLSATALLQAINTATGQPYEVLLANDFVAARFSGDQTLLHKWHQLILSKVIADKVDITSNGQSIAPPVLNFASTEIPDYQTIEVTEINEQQHP